MTYGPDEAVHRPFEGSVYVSGDGVELEGRIVPLTGVAIDDSHCLPEEARSVYRRNIVRFEPSDGSEAVLGWMETHRVFEV